MAVPAHKTEYFIIENSNLQKKANTAYGIEQVIFKIDNSAHYKYTAKRHGLF